MTDKKNAHKNKKDILIIDVRGASVAAAYATLGNTVEISRVMRANFVGADAQGLVAGMTAALEALLTPYAALGAARVHVVLGTPWHHAKIRTIQSTSDKSAPITAHTVAERVQNYKNEAPPAPGRTDIEAAAFETSVNDYPTALTHGVSGTSLGINLYESEADTTTTEALTRTIGKHLPHAAVVWHTFPLVAAGALRVMTQESAFAIADFDADVTDITVIERGAAVYRASFPTGYRAVESAAGTDGATRLALLGRGELSSEESGATRAAITPVIEAWLKDLTDTLVASADLIPIPRTVYLVTESAARDIMVESTCQGSLGLSCSAIEAPFIQKWVTLGEAATYDVPLSLAAVFFHIEAAQGVIYSS